MATVRAACPDCGDVELKATGVTVVHIAHHAGPDQTLYRIRCPKCRVISLKPCDPRAAELLIGSGAGTVSVALTPDTPSPLRTDPITDDECITLHGLITPDDTTVWQLFDVVADMHGDPS